MARQAARTAPVVAVAGMLVAVAQTTGAAEPAQGAALGRAIAVAGQAPHAFGRGALGSAAPDSAAPDSAAPDSRGSASGAAGSAGPAQARRAERRAAAARSRRAGSARSASSGRAAPTRKRTGAGAALRCTGTAGLLPANYAAIVRFLTGHGYTPMAAAGIAGNIYQESKGDPESVGTGGGGLIGFTPLPAGYVTGNPAADLHTQLEAILAYDQQWAQYIPSLNAATSPAEAADVYMDDFERPGVPAAYNRESAAEAVAAACGF